MCFVVFALGRHAQQFMPMTLYRTRYLPHVYRFTRSSISSLFIPNISLLPRQLPYLITCTAIKHHARASIPLSNMPTPRLTRDLNRRIIFSPSVIDGIELDPSDLPTSFLSRPKTTTSDAAMRATARRQPPILVRAYCSREGTSLEDRDEQLPRLLYANEEQVSECPLLQLPQELFYMILSRLLDPWLLSLSLTCKTV